MIPIEDVPAAAHCVMFRLLAKALPHGGVRFGTQYASPCPLIPEGRRSIDDIVVERDGTWKDRPGHAAGRDVIGLLSYLAREARGTTIRKLAAELSPGDMYADLPMRAADHLSDHPAAADDPADDDTLAKVARSGSPRQRAEALLAVARADAARHFRRCR